MTPKEPECGRRLLLINCSRSRTLKGAPHFAVVAVRKIRALHHEHVSHTLDRIDPRLSAPGATMTVRPRRKHFRHTLMRRAQDAGANSPAIICPPIPVSFTLEEAGGQVAGLRCGQEL